MEKKAFTLKEVEAMLMEFAQQLGQREGQYLPTIVPCEKFIANHPKLLKERSRIKK